MKTHVYASRDGLFTVTLNTPDGWAPAVTFDVPAEGGPVTVELRDEDAPQEDGVALCTASSWRDSGYVYGVGGYSRCVLAASHDGYRHEDGYGNLFVLYPTFRVVGHTSTVSA